MEVLRHQRGPAGFALQHFACRRRTSAKAPRASAMKGRTWGDAGAASRAAPPARGQLRRGAQAQRFGERRGGGRGRGCRAFNGEDRIPRAGPTPPLPWVLRSPELHSPSPCLPYLPLAPTPLSIHFCLFHSPTFFLRALVVPSPAFPLWRVEPEVRLSLPTRPPLFLGSEAEAGRIEWASEKQLSLRLHKK